MGDTDFHTIATILLRQGLEDHFAHDNVYVASNIVLYYKEGDATKRKDPDVLVAKKVGKHHRRSYRTWQEKVVPCVLWEIASKKTWRSDVKQKRETYARIKVKEYFVFDPEGRFLNPRLQGFRTVRGKSVPIKPNADGSLTSQELGLRLMAEGGMVRLIDLQTGRPIPAARDERADQEAERAQLEKLRADQEEQRAELERSRAQQATTLAKKLVLWQGEERFGSPSMEVTQALMNITELARLEDMTLRLRHARSWHELLEGGE